MRQRDHKCLLVLSKLIVMLVNLDGNTGGRRGGLHVGEIKNSVLDSMNYEVSVGYLHGDV